ncbi:hypothetical protein U1Q18_003285 [Sarracenia purpurea var. burkii]
MKIKLWWRKESSNKLLFCVVVLLDKLGLRSHAFKKEKNFDKGFNEVWCCFNPSSDSIIEERQSEGVMWWFRIGCQQWSRIFRSQSVQSSMNSKGNESR